MSAYIHRGVPDAAVVSGLWILHNAIFGVLAVAIGLALAGLSAGAAAEGLVAERWKAVGLVGALTLGVAGAATPAVLDGSKVMVVGLFGFLCWLAFVASASLAMLRVSPRRAARA